MRMTEQQFAALRKPGGGGAKKPKAITEKPEAPESPGEAALALQLQALRIDFDREFKFCPDRRWRADFRVGRVLVEVEGGIWNGGRHTRGTGFENDCEKYNWAALNGWLVLRYSTRQVMAGQAAKGIVEAMGRGME